MARLIDCPSCGGLRHASRERCPHCEAPGLSRRGLRRTLLTLALSGATMACLSVKYGIPQFICEELPDGGVLTSDPARCSLCDVPDGQASPCVESNPVIDAGTQDGGQTDG